jgi:hypothetical protein
VDTNSTGQKQQLTSEGEAKRTTKRPYVKPMVRHERVFETMALSCGKVHNTSGACRFNRRTS